jgi:hypothetical protein
MECCVRHGWNFLHFGLTLFGFVSPEAECKVYFSTLNWFYAFMNEFMHVC